MSLIPSRVEAFYAFMTERENIRLRRLLGWPREEWTHDEIFKKYSFTNVKREHDRTTHLLMREFYVPHFIEVMAADLGPDWRTDPHIDHADDPQKLLLNCAIFRYFGCVETARVIGWTDEWSVERRAQIKHYGDCDDLRFTAAYIVPNCGRSEPKYEIVLEIIDDISKKLDEIVSTNSWERQCAILSSCYGCGSFMAKEILLDYILATGIEPVDWSTWTPVGPGGRRGASRIKYGTKASISEEEALEVVKEVYEERGQYWRDDFVTLDLTDIQFQFCEWDKRSRVAEGRAPKRRFKPTIDEITRKAIP